MRYETLLLDFHGTFTSNRGRLAHALNAAYEEVLGNGISKDDFLAVFNRPEGISVTESLDTLINGAIPPDQKKLLIERYRERSEELYIPKHRHLIEKLHSLGVINVIVTNGNEFVVKDMLQQWGLDKYMTEIYGKGPGALLQGLPRKPNPDVIDHILTDLRSRGYPVRREKTLMVGDYQDDIGAGNSAGVHTAFLVTGPNQKPEFYNTRPTYALLDTFSLRPSSEWLQHENVYLFRDLPRIVKGEI